MIQVTIEDAYKEACTALGEAVVRERLLMKQVVPATDPPAEPTAADVPEAVR